MMKIAKLVVVLAGLVGLLAVYSPAQAQAPVPHHKEPFSLDTDAQSNPGAAEAVPFRQVIQSPGAPWLRIHFSDYNLGQGSFVILTSLQDGGQQRLDANSMTLWGGSSAYFNGDAVELALTVAPGDQGVYVRVQEITVGEWVDQAQSAQAGEAEPQEICGTVDSRTSSNDAAVGRIMPVGCTGWMISNGGNLTAGHCVGSNHTLQFNVPASTGSGTPVNPPPEDQYPVAAYTDSSNAGVGRDWAVFRTNPNGDGQTAIQRQGAFFRMTRDRSPVTVRETGYGIDGPSPLFGDGARNSDSQTQQTHAGPFVSETVHSNNNVEIRFQIDDENGNSGSPVIDLGISGRVTIGIATHAGCTSTGGSNGGVGFEHNGLENAIQTFPGGNVVYVDAGHPIASENGTVLRPWNTVAEGVNGASSGATLSIVAGSYPEPASTPLLIGADGKALTIDAPVGTVFIGN